MYWKKPTVGIILAAGMSTRFGEPKQLQKLKDRYLLVWVLDAALSSQLEGLILVLGLHFEAIRKALAGSLRHPRLRVVFNPKFAKGQSESLRTGLAQVKSDFPSAMFLLGDQPLMNSKVIDLLLDRFWASPQDICVPVCRGQRRNPAIFSRVFFDRLMAIEGDRGARELIRAHPGSVLAVEIDDPACFSDVDTEKDLADLTFLLA